MSVNVPTHYVMQFSSNISLLLQIQGSKLRGTTTEGSYVGKQGSPVDQIGAVEVQPVTGRFEPKVRTDAPTDRRWVYPSDFDLSQMIDHFDKLRLLTDPESTYVTNAVYAAGRQIDRLILAATIGTAKTGEAGATSTIFTANNEVDVATGGSNSRLNVAKLRALRELMEGQFVDFEAEMPVLVTTAKDNSALLNEIEVNSKEFKGGDAPVLLTGRVESFLGFQFKHSQIAETVLAGTNEVTLPVYLKSGMHLGIWNDIQTSVNHATWLKGEPFESYLMFSAGATRLEENKVYAVESYRA